MLGLLATPALPAPSDPARSCPSPSAPSLAPQLPETWQAEDVVQYTCPDGQYNDLATGLLGSAVWVIRSLLSLGSEAEPVNNMVGAWWRVASNKFNVPTALTSKSSNGREAARSWLGCAAV